MTPGTQWKHSGKKTIIYKFYRKDMTIPILILKRSAMPEGVTVATFSSEILRGLRTRGLGVSKEETEEVILDMMDNLTAMGYSQQWRDNVLKATIAGNMRVLKKEERGEASPNRKGKETFNSMRFKSLVGATEGFRVQQQ